MSCCVGQTGRLTRKCPDGWIPEAVMWEDGVRVGRHSRQRGAWYARGNGNKYFRKGNISGLGEYGRLEMRADLNIGSC